MKESDLLPLLEEPIQWQWGELYNKDGQKIRYGWNAPENARGLIVIAEGRTEVIEEYFENIRDYNAQGFACAIMDWQGQGMSYRYFDDNSRHHSEGFNHDMEDFAFLQNELDLNPNLQNLPKILFAHSMGGNLSLRYLAEHDHDFKCAVLSAPMLGLRPRRFIKYFGNVILQSIAKLGWNGRYAIGQSAWNEAFCQITKHKVSSDIIRQNLQPYLFKTRPELRCGGVTYGWVAHALESIYLLQRKKYCQKIKLPVFMGIAKKDVVVDNFMALKTARNLPQCEVHFYEGSQHQIHREKDEIRNEFMKDMITFINSHL
jgi:lysophospholipase